MLTEHLLFLFCPFGRYRHGCDPPKGITRASSLLTVPHYHTSSLAPLSDFFPFAFLSRQLNGNEPLLNPFRQTVTQERFPKLAIRRYG